MEKEIRICAQGAVYVPYSDLLEFQGDLKILTDLRYAELRQEIVERGFSFAPHFWPEEDDLAMWKEGESWVHRPGARLWILDGHQRRETIRRMVEDEGWSCPPLPCVPVRAKSMEEARLKLLGATSEYGTVQPEALARFVFDNGLDAEAILSRYNWPSIDVEDIAARIKILRGETRGAPGGAEEKKPPAEFKEHGEDIETENQCPSCGYQW